MSKPKNKKADEPAPPALHWLNVIINGDVQMRGCRFSIEAIAEDLNITGEAINRPDGSVEVEAWGGKDALTAFYARLNSVPRDNINILQPFIFQQAIEGWTPPDKFTTR